MIEVWWDNYQIIISEYQAVCVFSHVWFFCDPMDCRLSGSSVHGIYQARILEWVATTYSQDPWDLLNPRIESTSPALEGGFFTTASPGKPYKWMSLVGIQAHKGVLNAKWLMPTGISQMTNANGKTEQRIFILGSMIRRVLEREVGLIQTLKGG